MERITYTACPACDSPDITAVLKVRDYTVSKEYFDIWECRTCTLRFTQDIPSQKDIGQYYQSENYISHTDTREGLVNRLYHFVRNRTLEQKKKLIEATTGKTAGRLLDIGAGTGAFTAHLAKAGWQVTGLEPDAGTRQRAFDLYGIDLKEITSLFSLAPASYDVITMWHVLEHVHELHGYLEQVKKLLKPDGYALIAVPNYTSDDARFYGQFWAAYDVPRHLYHFSPVSMKRLIEMEGLKICREQPMWFDAFYVSMLSEQYRNNHSNLVGAFLHGLGSNFKTISDRSKCSSLIYIIAKAN